MSYENNSANAPMQTSRNLMQDLAAIPPGGVGIAVVLMFTVAGFLPWWGAVVIIAGGWVVVSAIENKHALILAKARASAYTNCIGPVVIGATAPDETLEEIEARADAWREKLKVSGNPYAEIIPVVVYPYTPVLTHYGGLSMTWSMYGLHLAQKQYEENVAWYNGKCPSQLKAQFAADVLPAPKTEPEL
jgi:hypothetical protein